MRARNVKIIATLGPASSAPDTIRALYEAGADVFRLNMSHQDRAALPQVCAAIRRVEQEAGHPISILADLQGPRPRIGRMAKGGATLTRGGVFVLDAGKTPGDTRRAPLPHPGVLAALAPGHRVFLDDGRIRLHVTACARGRVDTRVETGGLLTDFKGVNLPDTPMDAGPLLPADRTDLEAALAVGVDWIALSFVQRPEDLAETRKLARGRAAIMAKIEKPDAITHLEGIIHMADAIMVARGDLGVELPVEEVPGRQKQIIAACRRAGKPVVVATQMLDSMVAAPVPTRAEVSDVATAVFEGADAIMLSAESAVGAHPLKAVQTMDSVARVVEADPAYPAYPAYPAASGAPNHADDSTGADAIAAAAHAVADTLRVAAIVCCTTSGSTGLRVARERPRVPVIALTPVPGIARRLCLVWGLRCVLTEDAHDDHDMVQRACRIARAEGLAADGDRIVITAGVPFGTPGTTNLLRIAFLPPSAPGAPPKTDPAGG